MDEYRLSTLLQQGKYVGVLDELRRKAECKAAKDISTSEAYRNAGFDGEAWSRIADEVVVDRTR